MVVVTAGIPLTADEWEDVIPEGFKDPGLGKALKGLDKARKATVDVPQVAPGDSLGEIEEAIRALTKARDGLKGFIGALGAVAAYAGAAASALKKAMKDMEGKQTKAYNEALSVAEGMRAQAERTAADLR